MRCSKPAHSMAPIAETVAAVLEAAAEFTEGVLAPLNRSGDQRRRDGWRTARCAARLVSPMPKQYREGGWTGLAADPEFGGQGLPKALALAAFEMVALPRI